MSDHSFMDLEMAHEISEIVEIRQERFSEPLDVSIKVALLSYGDRFRIAHCITADWSGPKSELAQAASGLPLCPRCRKPCTEDEMGWRLGLIREEVPEHLKDLL